MPSSRVAEKADYSSGSSGRDYKKRTEDNGGYDDYKSSKSSRTMPPPIDSDRKGEGYSSRSANTSKEDRQYKAADNSSSRGRDADERPSYSDRSRGGDDSRSKPSGSSSRTVAERSSGNSHSRDNAGGSGKRDRDESPADENADLVRMETDSRSIYVGNVDYAAVASDLERHFIKCGDIVRVTIPNDKATGRSRGYAYIEFSERHAVDNALVLDQSNFRGRRMKVSSKRTNKPYAISGVYGRMHGIVDGGGGGGSGSGRDGRQGAERSFRREYGGNGESHRHSPVRSSGRDRYAPYDLPQSRRHTSSRYS